MVSVNYGPGPGQLLKISSHMWSRPGKSDSSGCETELRPGRLSLASLPGLWVVCGPSQTKWYLPIVALGRNYSGFCSQQEDSPQEGDCFLLSGQQPSCCTGRQLGSNCFPGRPESHGSMSTLPCFPPGNNPHSNHPHTTITDHLHDYLFSIFL